MHPTKQKIKTLLKGHLCRSRHFYFHGQSQGMQRSEFECVFGTQRRRVFSPELPRATCPRANPLRGCEPFSPHFFHLLGLQLGLRRNSSKMPNCDMLLGIRYLLQTRFVGANRIYWCHRRARSEDVDNYVFLCVISSSLTVVYRDKTQFGPKRACSSISFGWQCAHLLMKYSKNRIRFRN